MLAKVGAVALHAYRDAARKDDGQPRSAPAHRPANQFAVLGAWADQKAFEAHSAATHTKKLNEKLATMLAAPTDTRQHNALSVAPAKSGKDAVFAVTHVDVIPPQKDNGAAALKQLADDSRQHSGNLQFDVWQQTNRPEPLHRGRGLGQPRRVRRPRDAEGDTRVPHEARADVWRALRRAALQGRSFARCLAAGERRPLKIRRVPRRGECIEAPRPRTPACQPCCPAPAALRLRAAVGLVLYRRQDRPDRRHAVRPRGARLAIAAVAAALLMRRDGPHLAAADRPGRFSCSAARCCTASVCR